MIVNMNAIRLLRRRVPVDEHSFAAFLVWQVPEPVEGSAHFYKYSVAYIVKGVCVLRYDNERGKGDHKHVGDVETAYAFTTPEQLMTDFWSDVDQWRAST
ncbi:hypothetical protein AWB75_05175 [Caballeronia catudaia]|uniref:Uncharacterized protein n=1 Tax=Caballeronia catudaia TaxID=1777136 RepID=A0A158CHN7_9BURK|nr:DUF6516 family protein [Caballeronia catudaia]SAK81874.1 hypothetical protein AWB75_05175 [Caballeronia catudaia]